MTCGTKMKQFLTASLIALFAATMGVAQETENSGDKSEEAAQADAAFPVAQAGAGEPEPKATFGEWEQRCVGEGEQEQCVLVQFGKTEKGEVLSRVTITALPADAEAAAGFTIIGPLGVLLPAGLSFQVDDGRQNRYPFQVCEVQGCLTRFGITETEVEVMKGGTDLNLTVVPAAGNPEPVLIKISLAEFSAAWDALNAE